jgi:hypothetical protein
LCKGSVQMSFSEGVTESTGNVMALRSCFADAGLDMGIQIYQPRSR